MGFSLEADKQYKHPQRQLKFVCIIVLVTFLVSLGLNLVAIWAELD
jgi:hypothetical protein